jgi:murein DD-endopeptidase MepM/ murein hydrolase activator NlpD
MILCPLPGRLWRRTQGFGENPAIYKGFGLDGHNGVDLAPLIRGTKGVIVYAPQDGYCTTGNQGSTGYGKYVTILSEPINKDKIQRRSDLAHLETVWVKDGQFIHQGEPIGVMGATGFSLPKGAIHLHWTFKQMQYGLTLNYNNGYHGALDVWKNVAYWNPTRPL